MYDKNAKLMVMANFKGSMGHFEAGDKVFVEYEAGMTNSALVYQGNKMEWIPEENLKSYDMIEARVYDYVLKFAEENKLDYVSALQIFTKILGGK